MNKIFKQQTRVLFWNGLFVAMLSLTGFSQDAAAAVPTATSLVFNSNQYVEVPYQVPLDLSAGAFAVSAWIYPTAWGQNNQGRIIDHGGGSSGNSGWSMHIQNSGSELQVLKFQINNASTFNRSSNAGVITLNTWQHVAISFDNGTLTFYVNGIEQGISTGVPVPLSRSSSPRIGMRSTDLLRGFDGRIDELRIWDKALSAAELQASMNLELSGTESGLIAYYQFNSAQGPVALDNTAANNNATLGSTVGVDSKDPTWLSTVNQAPVVAAGVDQIIVLPNNIAVLQGSFSDDSLPGTTVLTSWSQVSGPATVVFSDASNVNTNATFSAAGVYQLSLAVDDGELVGVDDVLLTVDATAVLTSISVQSSANSVEVGETLTFTATGLDQAGNVFAISPVWNTTGGFIDAMGNYTAPVLTGIYTVTASDGAVSGLKSVSVFDSGAYIWPSNGWTTVTPASVGLQQTLLEQARDFAQTGGGSGYITKSGQKVLSWGSLTTRYDLKSTSKSFGAALAGLAVKDGLVNLDDLAQLHLTDVGLPPQANSATGWLDQITLKHLATHTAGFDKTGGFIDLLFQPGTVWSYTDGGANWLADVLTVSFNQDLNDILFDRLLTPMGLTAADLIWRNHFYRPDLINGVKRREFGSGISANVDAMARFGYLFLRQGEWQGQQLLPASYITELSTVVPTLAGLPVNLPENHFSASDHYGYLWWNNADGTMPNVPTDAYWGWGLFDSLIIVIPSLDMVIARAGSGWRTGWDSDYSVIEPFLEPIVLSTLGENYFVTSGAAATVLDVLSNDMSIDFENETLTIISVGATSAGGTVTNSSTTLSYTPAVGFIGQETFDYTVQGSSGITYTVTVTIDVQAIVADGDLTDDGVVDVRDILRAYQIILGLVTPDADEIKRGDVAPLINGAPVSDGVFNLGDLLVIQRKVIGDIIF